MEGWLLLHRKMQDNGLWQDKPFAKGQAWIDLLMSASHKDHSFWVRGIEIKVNVGQVPMSELTMSKRWGWSRNKVRRFLSYLENCKKVEQQKSSITSLITILNWKDYQQKGQQTKQQKDNRKTTNDTQSKNVNNENKKELTVFFETIWAQYPKKDGKKESLRHFLSSVKTEEDMKNIQTALDNYKNQIDGTDRKYIKNGSTWFNNWQDFIETDDSQKEERNWL